MRSESILEETYKGYTIKVAQDQDIYESPRKWSTLGKMLCYNKKYDLGDNLKDIWCDTKGYSLKELPQFCDGWDEIEGILCKEFNAVVVKRLFLYDHGGITISTSAFSCPWDSGCVGFIYATRDDILKEFGKKKISKTVLKKVNDILENEVKTYDKYLRGNVYGYMIEKDGEHIDSCWGYYDEPEYVMQEAKNVIDGIVEKKVKEHIKYLKEIIKNKVNILYRKPLIIGG